MQSIYDADLEVVHECNAGSRNAVSFDSIYRESSKSFDVSDTIPSLLQWDEDEEEEENEEEEKDKDEKEDQMGLGGGRLADSFLINATLQ